MSDNAGTRRTRVEPGAGEDPAMPHQSHGGRSKQQAEASDSDPLARELTDLHERPSAMGYLKLLTRFRGFIVALGLANVKVQTAGRLLGISWLLLTPLLMSATYLFIFGFVFKAGRGVDNFVGFLVVGVLAFAFINRSTTAGASSIINNRALIHNVYFPRASLPIAAVVAETIGLCASLPVALTLGAIYGTLGVNLLFLPLVVVVAALFSLSMACVFSILANRLSDVRDALPFLIQIWFYFSGIMYPRSFVDGQLPRGIGLVLFDLNPGYLIPTLFRIVFGFAEAGVDVWRVLIASCMWVGLGLVVSIRAFSRNEVSLGA